LRVFLRRSQAYIYYLLGSGKSSPPESITLFLTHRCNLRCRMCGQWGDRGVTRKMAKDELIEELSYAEIKDFLDGVASFHPNITIFGGEPLLHPDCLKVISYIKKNNMHCLMITNGSLIKEFAASIVDTGLDELNVSLDGKEKLHDEIRGMPGLFDKIYQGLKEISQIKKGRNLKKPLVNLQCTINQYNYRNLTDLIEVARDIKADSLTYHNLIFLEQGLLNEQKPYDERFCLSSKEWSGFVFKPELDPDEIYLQIKKILSAKYDFSLDFYPNFSHKELRQYYSSDYNPKHTRCLSPWIVAYIFPDGNVRPCLNFSYTYGNIKKDRFSLIWNSPNAVQYRSWLKEIKSFPVCLRCTELYRY